MQFYPRPRTAGAFCGAHNVLLNILLQAVTFTNMRNVHEAAFPILLLRTSY
ncbi:hypothetical protein [Hydrogenoanaerobacterium sp.]|uniref:hypothetical protein n=1 Tax=Hydrogenoanaerobacterium sp. TaxID=2953763 RepID=UPI00289A3642|nr:hypothetical protein [Hydrogenoanaerobacterium sp.]